MPGRRFVLHRRLGVLALSDRKGVDELNIPNSACVMRASGGAGVFLAGQRHAFSYESDPGTWLERCVNALGFDCDRIAVPLSSMAKGDLTHHGEFAGKCAHHRRSDRRAYARDLQCHCQTWQKAI